MFRGSWKIARIAGIDIFVHWSFALIIIYVLTVELMDNATMAQAWLRVLLVLCVFVCIVMHEYGHALTARKFGIRTREITLLPIGGVARLEKMPEDPKQELLVALAGPAVNVVIAVVLGGLLYAAGGLSRLTNVEALSDNIIGFVAQLAFVNAFLVVFNMIPAFPMDGGRVLRAILALWLDYGKATNIAANVGKIFAVLLGIASFTLGAPFLVFIAIFVYFGAAQEAKIVQTKMLLTGVTVQQVMSRDVRALTPLTRLSDLVQELSAGLQDFPVMDGHELTGMLYQQQIIQAVRAGQQDQNVASVMAKEFETATPEESLDAALTRMQETQVPTLPVLQDGQLVGVLNVNHINQWMMFQMARNAASKLAQRMSGRKPDDAYDV